MNSLEVSEFVTTLCHAEKDQVRALGRAIYKYGDHAQFGTDDQVRNALQELRNTASVALVTST